MTDFSNYEVDLDTQRPNPNDVTKVLRGDAPRTAFTKYNDLLVELNGVVRHIGPEAPSPTIAYMLWVDTSVDPAVERQRNSDNTAWGLSNSIGGMLGQPNGIAQLDGGGKVPAAQLPSYVDDVLEFPDLASFPIPGEPGKIYVAIDTNRNYRWTGSDYLWNNPSPGSTDALAEGSVNQYFTPARVRDTVLAGLATVASAAIAATDTVLGAFAKLQAQILLKANISNAAFTGFITISDTTTAQLRVVPASGSVLVSARNSANTGYTSMVLDGEQEIFRVSGTERMRLNTAGTLQINTTGTSQGKLQVNGDVVLGSGAGERGNKLWLYQISSVNGSYISTSVDGAMTFSTGTTAISEVFRFTPTGALGLGTSTPTNYTGAGYQTLAINHTTGAILEFQSAGVQQARVTGWSNTLGIHTNNIERVRINDSGLVLQGVTPLGVGVNPTFPTNYSGIHVHNATASQGAMVRMTNAGTGSATTDGAIISSDPAGVMYIWNYENASMVLGTNNTDRFTITATGNVLVGKTSGLGYKVDVLGQIGVEDGTIRAGWGAGMFTAGTMGFGTTSNHSLSIGTNAITRMTMTNSGQVVVGRAAPASGGMFEVNGALVFNPATATPTLGTNGDVGFQRVSNTQLRLFMRGDDGVTRSVTLTLA